MLANTHGNNDVEQDNKTFGYATAIVHGRYLSVTGFRCFSFVGQIEPFKVKN